MTIDELFYAVKVAGRAQAVEPVELGDLPVACSASDEDADIALGSVEIHMTPIPHVHLYKEGFLVSKKER